MALIILAHPDINRSTANKTIVEELKRSDLDVMVRDISALYPDFIIDAKEEQNVLTKHQTIVFQYPLYWYNMPGILKHWFDVVFEYQFAYGSMRKKLENKNYLPSFTVGAAENGYAALGEHHFRVAEFCKNLEQTAYFTRMNYIDPIYFHGTSLNAGFTKASVEEKARSHAEKLIHAIKNLEKSKF